MCGLYRERDVNTKHSLKLALRLAVNNSRERAGRLLRNMP